MGSFHGWVFLGVVGALAHLILACPLLGAEGGASVAPFRVGFSRSLFTDVNENDAKASIRALAQALVRERGINMSPAAQLYDRPSEMAAALKNGEVEVICAPFDEYHVIDGEVKLSDRFGIQIGGDVFDEFLLLVHTESQIGDLAALRGRQLLWHDNARTRMAMDWLNTLLVTNGFSEARGFFKEVTRCGKLSPTVLRVFFRQADVCIVAKSGFRTLCELNPQLQLKLKILASSPPLMPGVMFFRKDFDSPEKDKIMATLEKLHETPSGQQVLTIFQSEKLVPIHTDQLADTESFLRNVNRLRFDATIARNVEASSGPAPAGGAHP